MTEHKKGSYTEDCRYKIGQCAEHFIPWFKKGQPTQLTPEWFIDLGPGCACEHEDALKAWPGVKLLGLEPSDVGFRAANTRWPKDGKLLKVAAWDSDGEAVLYYPEDLLHSTLFVDGQRNYDNDTTNVLGTKDLVTCPTRSLDSLDLEYGPFNNVALWMDIEGAERRALKGAASLLARRAIIAVNIEVRPPYAGEIAETLGMGGLKKVYQYFVSEHVRDEVWVKR